MMEFNDTYFLTLKKIYRLAQAVQTDIQTFQPDVLIVLARGGLGPLWALQALWEETKAKNIPPVVVTNLGREKLLRYEYHRAKIGMPHWPDFEPFAFLGDGEQGYFLLWLEQQMDWRKELRQQVDAVLGMGCQPARILVIDDTVYKRYTTLIALGLLLAEFPRAQTWMMAGNLPDWRPDLAAPWLAEHANRQSSADDKQLNDSVYNLATGASDTDRFSLQWEPLNASSLAMREYGKYLSVETWLKLSGWMKEQIQAYVRQAVGHPEALRPNDGSRQEDGYVSRPILRPEELAFRQRWLTANLTPQEASHELDLSVESAKQLLDHLAAWNGRG